MSGAGTVVSIPRILVAGTHSGVGKTSVVAGLLAALRRRGLVVQPFKCGPDYIDPGYHTHAAGRACRNLDTWMLGEEAVLESFVLGCRGADIAVIEGVMGLFDGSDFLSDKASAANVARLLGAPVVLVSDISGCGRSAAAVVHGFRSFDPALNLAGVVFNFAGSRGHAEGCAAALASRALPPMLGWLPRNDAVAVPERNLGLTTRLDHASPDALIASLADAVESGFDLGRVLDIARAAPALHLPAPCSALHADAAQASENSSRAPVLAVASDEAFCFHYPDNLDLLRAEGVDVRLFSPLRGEPIPADADGLYLGGGYPELHAATLAANQDFMDGVRALHAARRPILAECGGFMVLTQAIVDDQGGRHAMAGLVPGETVMTRKLQGLGYREATCLRDTLLGPAGTVLRAHEFHYSSWELPASHTQDGGLAFTARGTGTKATPLPCGWAEGTLLASYLHFHLGQDRALARRLAHALRSR